MALHVYIVGLVRPKSFLMMVRLSAVVRGKGGAMCAQENGLVRDAGTSVGRPAVLGLPALEGFAPGDLTSPARALRAGALVDVGLDSKVTELRIHGVSGSSGSMMLEHPATVQVAGDRLAGFHRRWTPAGQGCVSVPWRAEAYL